MSVGIKDCKHIQMPFYLKGQTDKDNDLCKPESERA